MKIAVIGAGSAGLAAVKHCTSGSYVNNVVCYEKSDQVGGTWVYKEETGVDEYGLLIHTSMYKSLRTNLPKEVMGYPDYPVSDHHQTYLPCRDLLSFLNSYCDSFNLRDYIRFRHNVETVKRIDGDRKWSVTVRDLRKNIVSTDTFDAVMVCSGHYFAPSIPTLKGQDIFRGQQSHSHYYRVPDAFTDKRVVVFGAGPSGLDLVMEISRKAKRVIFSHHSKGLRNCMFPNHIIQKPDVKELTEWGVVFEDGTSEDVDVVFYCTGYKYMFPFLDENCGVRVESNMVTPLWKHIISIENPTLAFVGIVYNICSFNTFDLQVRFALEYWFGKTALPSKSDMLREERAELEKHMKEGLLKRHFHCMGSKLGDYFIDLARTAGIKPLAPVITTIFNDCLSRFWNDYVNYRNVRYKIINEHNYVRI